LLIAQIAISGSKTITAPAGWNLRDRTVSTSATSPITQAIYWRLHRGASETQNHSWSWTGTAEAAGGITLYTGVSMSNPFDAWTVDKTTGGTSFSMPSFTTSNNNTMLLAFLASAQNGSGHTVPQNSDGTGKMGMNPGNHDYDQNGQDVKRLRITFAAQSGVAANTTVAKVANHKSTVADNVAHLLALRPASADSTTPTLTIALPPGTVNNDVMIASILFSPCSAATGASCTTTITPPAGWTQVNTSGGTNTTTDGDGGTDGYGSRLHVYRKVANNELSSYNWTFGGVTSPRKIDAVGGIVSFSGVDTSNPIDVQAGQANSSDLTQKAPSITTTIANTMLVAAIGTRSSGSFGSPSAGLEPRVNRASRPTPHATGLTLAMYNAPFPTASATNTRQAVLSGGTADTGMGHLLALRPAPSGPHHLEIVHGSGSGVTCTPSTLTIRACADAACTSLYTSGVTGTLSASGGPTVNWQGGSSSFSIPSGISSVTKNIQVTTPGSVLLGALSGTPSASNPTTCNFGTPSCTFTVADSGFLLSVPNHVSETSATLTIRAVRKSDNSLSCVPGITGTKSVNFKCSYGNPATSSLPVRISGIPLADSATSACRSGGENVSLTFDDTTGVATSTVNYADVGQVQLTASYTGSTGAGSTEQGLSLTGNTTFIAAPAKFEFSGITTGLIKAGDDFSATVTAKNSKGDATHNFGRETTPQGVSLASELVSPSGGINPALKNNVIAGATFKNGAASVTNLGWDEVGVIKLKAALSSASGTYLGADIFDSNGQKILPTGMSSDIDRFIPNHFETQISGGINCPSGLSCPNNRFIYSQQAFTVNVVARNLSGEITKNYEQSHAKDVTLSAFSVQGGSTPNPNCGKFLDRSDPANSFVVSADLFNDGVGSLVHTPFYTLPDTCAATNNRAPGPTDIYVRAINTDAVSSLRTAPAVSQEAGIKVGRGRIWLDNAYGSEQGALPINFMVQYWNGSDWTLSQTDSATTFLPTDARFSDCRNNLVQPNTSRPNNCKPVLQAASAPSPISVSSGKGSFLLNAPGIGNTGMANLWLNAPAYLPSTTSLIRFGLERSRVIYMREIY
jgi:MSHA biogenesis protein MshQ